MAIMEKQARDMTQRLGALALTENPGLVPRTQIAGRLQSVIPVPRKSKCPPLASTGIAHSWWPYPHAAKILIYIK